MKDDLGRSMDLKPSIGRAVILLDAIIEIRLCRIRIGFTPRRDRSCGRFSASHDRMASRLAWLLSMTIRSGRPCCLKALRRERLAAVKLRRSLNRNSTVSPVRSMAGSRYFH